MGVGVALWALTWLSNRSVRGHRTGFGDIEHLGEWEIAGPPTGHEGRMVRSRPYS